MPAAEGKPRRARHGRGDSPLKPYSRRPRETRAFVTRMYLTLSYSPQKKTGCCGVTHKQWGTDGQRTCGGLQQEGDVERKSSSPKESLSSQNPTLISPIVVSQMIDETKSKENWPALPMRPMVPQPSAHHTEQSLADHGSVDTSRALMVLPSRVEIQASLVDTTSPRGWPIPVDTGCQSQKKGFASITVTSRRVTGSSRAPGAVQEPRATLSRSLQHWPPAEHADQGAAQLQSPAPCSQSARKRLFDPGSKERGVGGLQSRGGGEKAPPSFTSRVHVHVSPQCPNTIYYLAKSLDVCLDQPRVKCPKIHRSALSFSIKCSSARVTADGVDGIANGEPREERLQTKLLGENKTPLRSNLSAGLTEKTVINKEQANEGYLGSKYPSQSVFAGSSETFVAIPRGPNKGAATKKDDDKHSGSYHTAFSPQLPNSSDEAGMQMLLGSKKRQSTMDRNNPVSSGSFPGAASRKAITAAPEGSLKMREPSKDTSTSKEIQAQGILKPKMSVSGSMCNVKTSSGSLLEENGHGQNQLLKSAPECHGWRDTAEESPEEGDAGSREPGGPRQKQPLLSRPETSSQPGGAPRTLQEALELHNPQFISRSQERLKRLQHMVQLRKAQQGDAPPSNQGALPVHKLSSTPTAGKKRQYTIPDPLSDNLFRPKERFIPEKEMHMRSKRIYDKLPEVKKKQEEKQKRIIIQSNRLRVEIFKKQLLDQLLQRNTE